MQTAEKLLILADDSSEANSIKEYLGKDCTIIDVIDCDNGFQAAIKEKPNVILLVGDFAKQKYSHLKSELEKSDFPVLSVRTGEPKSEELDSKVRQTLTRNQCDEELFEQKQALEDKIRDKESKFQHLFNSLNDAVFIHDLEGKFLEVNDVACKRYGYSREEFFQMSPMDIDTPEHAKLVHTKIEKLLLKGSALFEIEQVTKDGHIFPVELSSRLIEYEGQKAVLTIARDISQRKISQDELF